MTGPIDGTHARISPEIVDILAQNHQRFLAFTQARVGSRADAEEILQSAFVRGVEAAGTVRHDESVVAWFYRVLRNAIVDHHRRRGAERKALERIGRELPENAADAPAEVRDTLCACIGDLLPTLKPQEEDILRKIDLGERSVQEVAEDQGITSGHARVRLHRARHALRERVQATCGTCAEHGCLDCTCRHLPRSGAAPGGRL